MHGNPSAAYPASFWALTFVGVIGWAGMVVTPLLTLYLTVQLGFSPLLAGAVLSVYGIGGTVAVIFSGVVVDAFGAKRVLLGAMLISVLVTIALSFTSSLIAVCTLVLVYGAAAQSMLPAYNALVAENSPLLLLRRAYSIQHIAGNLGFAILPLVGGILSGVHYSLIFYFEAALVTIAIVIVATLIPLRRTQPEGGGSTPPLTSGRSSRLSALREMSSVFGDGVFVRFLVASVVFSTMFKQTQITMPLVMESQGHGAGFYGFILMLNGLGVVLLQLPSDRITARMSPSRVVVLGAFISGIGFTLQAFAHSPRSYMLIVVVWSIGELFHFAISNNIVSRLAPEGFRGRYLGAFALANCVASLLGPLVGSAVLEVLGSTGLWLFCGAVLFALTVFRWACRHEIDRRLQIG